MMTVEEYNECMGLHCPVCESTDIRGYQPMLDGELVTRFHVCHSCDAEWLEHLGVIELELMED